MTRPSTGISMVVCCYNSRQRLPKTLTHLSQQVSDYKIEVLLIDNASSDGTGDFAKEYWQGLETEISLTVLQESQPGLSHARHLGLSNAAYDFVLFVDDDNWLAADYAQLAVETMTSDATIGACGGRGEPASDQALPEWFDLYPAHFATGDQASYAAKSGQPGARLYGAGLCLRKAIYLNLVDLGFESILSDRKGKQLSSGGDTELTLLINMLGYKLVYVPEMRFKHYMEKGRMTETYLLKLTEAMGKSAGKFVPYLMEAQPSLPKNKKSWLYQVLISSYNLLRYRMNSSKGLDRQTQLAYSKARRTSLLNSKSTYKSTRRKISRLIQAYQDLKAQ